ncbi:MAG: hypothetical protein ACOC32_01140 [Nanoarchaeota archaeon]
MAKRSGGKKKTVRREKNGYEIVRDYILNREFKGNIFVLATFIIFGVFIPPLLSLALIYCLYKTVPQEPRFFDRHFFIYLFSLLIIQFIYLALSGMAFADAAMRTGRITVFIMLLIYPFIYAWLWFDWNYS